MFGDVIYQVDWGQELDGELRFDLTCPVCQASGQECEFCDSMGFIAPLTEMAWATGVEELPDDLRRKLAVELGVFASTDKCTGLVVLAPYGWGSDYTPNLACAFLELGYSILPGSWVCRLLGLGQEYVVSFVGQEWASRLYHTMRRSLQYNLDEAQHFLPDVPKTE